MGFPFFHTVKPGSGSESRPLKEVTGLLTLFFSVSFVSSQEQTTFLFNQSVCPAQTYKIFPTVCCYNMRNFKGELLV